MFFDAPPTFIIGPVGRTPHLPRRVEAIHDSAPGRVLARRPGTAPIPFDAFLRESEQLFPLKPYWAYARRHGDAPVEQHRRPRADAPRPRPDAARLGDVSPTRLTRTEHVYRLITRIERPLKLGSVIDEIV